MKKTKKSRAEEQTGSKLDNVLATRLFELIVSDPKIRLHLEARMDVVPTKGALDAVNLGVCQRNQEFLSFLMENFRWLWYDIDTRPKQDDIIEPEAKEAKLRKHLFGEGDDELGPTPDGDLKAEARLR